MEAIEEGSQPILISVGSDGERTINERVASPLDEGGLATADVFLLERKRREVEKRLREIEAREAVLKGKGNVGAGRGKRSREDHDGSDGAATHEAPTDLQPKRRLLSSAVLTSQVASRPHATHRASDSDQGRDRKRARNERDPHHHSGESGADNEGSGSGSSSSSKRGTSSGRGDEEREKPRQRERAAREEGTEERRDEEREERERRQKEREEREKEWVKKAGGDATRNRRVFGVLLGTLQRFRKDQTAVAEKERVREQITKQVEEKVKEESEHLIKEEERRLADEKEKNWALREELTQQIEELQLRELQSQWDKHHKLVSRFRKTEAKPHICYAFNDGALTEDNAAASGDHRRQRMDRDHSDSSDSDSESDAEPLQEEDSVDTMSRGREERQAKR